MVMVLWRPCTAISDGVALGTANGNLFLFLWELF